MRRARRASHWAGRPGRPAWVGMPALAQVNLACPRVEQLILCGDAKITFYTADTKGSFEKMFACCINTKFVDNGKIHLSACPARKPLCTGLN
jgi:hypothetical protein